MSDPWVLLPIVTIGLICVFFVVCGACFVRRTVPSTTWQTIWIAAWMLFSFRYLVLPVEDAIAIFIAIYDPIHNLVPGVATMLPCPEHTLECSVLSGTYAQHANWMVGFVNNFHGDALATNLLRGHIVLSALALGLFPIQLWGVRRGGHAPVHKFLGRVIGLSAVIGSSLAMLISLLKHYDIPEYGGALSIVGFGSMWAAVVVTTVLGYRAIRAGDLARHQKWNIRLFGVLFGSFFIFRVEPLLLQCVLPSPVDVFVYETTSWMIGMLIFDRVGGTCLSKPHAATAK